MVGGSSISADSAMAALLYTSGAPGDRMPGLGAVPGRIGWVNERAELVRAVLGRTACGELSSVLGSWEPELRRRWGGPSPLGDCGIIVRVSVYGEELAMFFG